MHVGKLLNKYFLRQKKVHQDLSLRSLAKKLKISPGYLSKILSGQKNPDFKIIEKICKELKLDDLQRDQVLLAYEEAVAQNLNIPKRKNQKTKKLVKSLSEMVLMEPEAEWLLNKWYRLVILDLATCENFKFSANWVSKKLSISGAEAEEALRQLKSYGYLSESQDGKIKKTHEKFRFPAQFSKEIIRNYHEMQMKRAADCMKSGLSQEDYKKRLITSLTVAMNPEHFELVKIYLERALYEASEMLSQGPCLEVYQLNLQFFPQTK